MSPSRAPQRKSALASDGLGSGNTDLVAVAAPAFTTIAPAWSSDLLANQRSEWPYDSDADIPARLANAKTRDHFQNWIKPGSGIMWLQVEAFIAERDGREDAAALKARIEAHYERARRMMRDM